MPLIIVTGKTQPAKCKERCARCRKTIQIGDMQATAQVHYIGRFDYRFASVHIPKCK